MKKVKRRTYSLLLLVAVIAACMVIFLVRLVSDGRDWVTFPTNQNIYSEGVLTVGSVYDRNGVMLASSVSGVRAYNESETVRKSTLHVVGDYSGSIGTGALQVFADSLVGYNLVSGTYSVGGSGGSLALTIDADLNSVAYEALAGRNGAVVVMDYETGEILCCVSTPTYDPANKPEIADDDPNYDGVYLNRVFSSTFTPGSIYKIVTAACALDTFQDAQTRQYVCNGVYEIDGSQVTCTGTHGTLDLAQAMGHSCNCYFAQLALDLGGDRLAQYTEQFGLTETHDVDGITTAAGSFVAAESGSVALAWSGVGQYENLINPLSMVRFMGAIANGGTPVEPRIVSSLSGSLGSGFGKVETGDPVMSTGTATQLNNILASTVTDYYGGTFPGLAVCGKTGTAEVGEGKQPHSWFAGYLDDPESTLAFVVLVENAGSGLSGAGAVSNTVLQAAVAAGY